MHQQKSNAYSESKVAHETQTIVHGEEISSVLNVDTLAFIDNLIPPLVQLDKLVNVNCHIRQIKKLCTLKGID